MNERYELVGLGVSCIDDLLLLESFPQPNHKQQVLSMTRQCGGLTGSALVAAARLGVSCGQVISLGEGELSNFIRLALTRERVGLLVASTDATVEPYHSIILVDRASGERSILFDNSHTRPPEFGARERAAVLAAKCLFVDHVFASAQLPLAREARASGIPVVGDFERITPDSLALMALTDHIILPLSFARSLYGESESVERITERLASEPGRTMACVTDGTRGSWWALGREPGRIRHQPSFPVENVVDTTGCGDVFHGVYAAGVVQDLPFAERLRRASAAAALKTRKAGAQAGAPTLSELTNFLASR